MKKKSIGLYKWVITKDHYFMGEILYPKGIYKDISECNAGWYKQIGSLI